MHARQKLGTSERRTCKVVGLARSSMQYQAVEKNDDALRLAMIRLAKSYGRYGYRKVAQLLRVEGWRVNHKKVERLWREEGLQLPQRHKKKRRLYHKDSSIIRLRPTHPNHVWSVDFVHDKLSNGRSYKMLTVLDEYTRQALAVEVRTRMGSEDVLEVLYGLFLRHGKPDFVRSDNGPEFSSRATQSWLEKVGVNPIRIYPGLSLGERIQREVQWNAPPRGSQFRMVHNDQAGTDRDQLLAQAIQPHPTPSGPQHAPTSPRNSSPKWPRTWGLDNKRWAYDEVGFCAQAHSARLHLHPVELRALQSSYPLSRSTT
ncbi:DDE-type integrase/transposase/recombinase [Ruegeria faecimaris]|uniref:DDE-type integrase/transposase/recombinase n=1 Tax=Ruegeria faecimaris TaxID=686389 RepID=UPI00248FE3AC|nr:DDE-type integrase/transposase/recombinase [Ruegeria faecimaris]